MRIHRILTASALLTSLTAGAAENIIRPYQGIRSSGMGSVRMTTGLYEENFFGNPARATKNPKFRVTIFDINAETTTGTISNIGTIVGGGDDMLSSLANTAGTNTHVRNQTTWPAVYIPNMGGGKMSYALGLISSLQADLDLQNSFRLTPQAVVDIGPAMTVARKFLENDALSVGVTVNATYRLTSDAGFTLIDLIQGRSISPAQSGGEGTHIDGSLGGLYTLPFHPIENWDLEVGGAINNLLGGKYSNLAFRPGNLGRLPLEQPRDLGFGFAARRAELGVFMDTVFALELTDILNNTNGSLFRTIHLGGETHWRRLALRLGLNQGYPTVGLGADLRFFTVDLAYYGEELSLNAGGRADHRLAFRMAFQVE